jgi:LAO/AO transport system kinase
VTHDSRPRPPADPLPELVLRGDVRAIARAITLVDNETPEGAALVGRLYPRTGRAFLVGITGPPGAGKSTLIDRLIARIRQDGRTVGVLAVDPTSPFSGGAILGDRVRMAGHAHDAGVFIRSMATRGQLGGLSRTAADAAIVLDAAGRDLVIIETVGVGQDEVDIVRTADISIVVLVPGAGDDVQALKAGIMEIGDIFVVNKADRDGADRLVESIQAVLALPSYGPGDWRPPVLLTQATTGDGVDRLWETIETFRTRSDPGRAARRRERAEFQLRERLARQFLAQVDRTLPASAYREIVDAVAARDIDPSSAALRILRELCGVPPDAPH